MVGGGRPKADHVGFLKAGSSDRRKHPTVSSPGPNTAVGKQILLKLFRGSLRACLDPARDSVASLLVNTPPVPAHLVGAQYPVRSMHAMNRIRTKSAPLNCVTTSVSQA